MRTPNGNVHVITEMDPTGGDPLQFGWTVTRETLLTPAHAAVIAAAEAWDHYFFDSRLNKNRQMREDDLHYALMKLRATTPTEPTP